MTVYLAIARGAGLMKLGMTDQLRCRIKALAFAGYGPVDLLAAIDGGRTREEALKWLMREERVEGEWFRECFRLHALADAMKWHELRWLAAPEKVPGSELRKAVLTRYGSLDAAAAALDCSPYRMRQATAPSGYFSPIIYGRFLVEEGRRSTWRGIDKRLLPQPTLVEAA